MSGLLIAVVSIAFLGLAGSAHAQTPVAFVAQDPMLSYGTAVFGCDSGTADGTVDSEGRHELALEFFACSVGGGMEAAVDCEGTVSLFTVNPSTDEATAVLNDGFACDIVIPGVCTISVEGPQDPPDAVSRIDFGEDTFEADVNMAATRSGSTPWGPASGTLNWSGFYEEVP